MTTIEQELSDLLAAEGVDPRTVARIAAYGALLLEANATTNLTGARSATELLPHLLDSVSIAPYIAGRDLVDVGSGGGLPAIPLAIALNVPVTLIEATTKKAKFLERCLTELGLDGRVVAERAEEAGHLPGLREHFSAGTARAVASAPAVAELVLPFIVIGGTAVLQRGEMEDRERNALADAAPMLGGKVDREVPLVGDNRRIVLVDKVAATPERFPRRTGIPAKRPLCL